MLAAESDSRALNVHLCLLRRSGRCDGSAPTDERSLSGLVHTDVKVLCVKCVKTIKQDSRVIFGCC